MIVILGTSIALAGLAGFAVQRGGVCVVAAARDGVLAGKWAGFIAFFECAAWALCCYLLLDAFSLRAIDGWSAPANWLGALLGGALFGCGALVNGACAYGSMGRLAAGEISFLAMLAGFFLGAKGSQYALAGNFPVTEARFAMHGLALLAVWGILSVFVLVQAVRAMRGAHGWPGAIHALLGKSWPVSVTMAVIALANVGLIGLWTHWTYTGLLIDLAAGHPHADGLRALLAMCFLGGAVWGARSAGRFRWRLASWRALSARGSGGALMGAGAALIPGGNDGLIVMGLPLMLPNAILAYASMSVVVLAGFALGRLRQRGDGAI